MSPVEKLARIRYEELGFKELWEDVEPEIREDEMRIARRQIRALAELELMPDDAIDAVIDGCGLRCQGNYERAKKILCDAILLLAEAQS